MSEKSTKSAPKRAKEKPSAASKADLAGASDDAPYPGLNFYQYSKKHQDLFAGRADEIIECGDMLFNSRVLILHGPTGCGKSSFLRAGVKPRIARLDKEAKFAVGPDQFDVIRSSGRPLSAFVKRLADIVAIISSDAKAKSKEPLFGPITSAEALSAAEAAFASDAKIDAMSKSGSLAYRGYRSVQRALKGALILVIDQGEEVFTLNDERRLHEEHERRTDNLTYTALFDQRMQEMSAYFAFLRTVAATGGGPLVVSLRTEYKGHFDDSIAGTEGHPGIWLKGFYLRPLEMEGIVEAIRRPALSNEEWTERYQQGKVESPTPPPTKLRLVFGKERAEQLAKELLKPDAIPPGGVLPALQVACTRLYEQAVAASAGTLPRMEVTRAAIMRLGSVATQVEEFVSSKIEEVCEPKALGSPLTSGQLSSLVHRGLAKTLVGVEADGRAVTRRLPEVEFNEAFAAHFGAGLKQHAKVRDSLLSTNILRREENPKTKETWWSLGHDSIALCLMKWRVPEGKEDPAMMRMAMMGGGGKPSSWDYKALYPPNEHRNFETPMELAAPREFLWDRQLPFFAAEQRFDERLGFKIVTLDELDATDVQNGPPTWLDIVNNVRSESKKRYDHSKTSLEKKSMIVAGEWGAFPLIIRDENSNGSAASEDTQRAKKKLEKLKLDPKSYARHWTDIATTNTNFGNGLIGPEVDGLPTLRQIEVETDGNDVTKIREGMKAILNYLERTKPQMTSFDLRAKEMLLFAADLVFTAAEQGDRDRIKAFLSKPDSRLDSKYSIKDPIVERLLAQPDLTVKLESGSSGAPPKAMVQASEREQRREIRPGEQHFAVAGAFPRAMATQSGYKVYFGAKHVAWLARVEMDHRKQPSVKPKYAPDVRDLAEATQRIISHTLWQFSLPNARWDLGADRARVLRLASLAYYTTEYARSSMDETVAFLQRFAIKCLAEDTPSEHSLRGVRLNRAQVREAVGECFNFVRFDEYANEVFDLDAPFAYWSDHSDFESKSVAQAIYQELVSLRQATLTHFDTVVGAISWLRYDDAYFPSSDKEVSQAFAFKEFAWKHFRIMNFYDSERFMSKAASLLSQRLETIGRDKESLRAKRDEAEEKLAKASQAEKT